MLRQFIKISLWHLARNKGVTGINIAGLTFGITFSILICSALNAWQETTELTGLYLDQKPPGLEPAKLLPEILTSEKHPHGKLAFSSDGKLVLWSAMLADGPEQAKTSSARNSIAIYYGKYLFFIRSCSRQFIGDQAHFYRVSVKNIEEFKPKDKYICIVL